MISIFASIAGGGRALRVLILRGMDRFLCLRGRRLMSGIEKHKSIGHEFRDRASE